MKEKQNKIILPDFILIPYQLLEDKNITLIDERLYGIIYWFSRLKLEKCRASNQVLAKLVKTTPTVIGNSLTKLEKLEYIKRIFKDKDKKIRLEIKPLVVFSKVSPTDDTSVNVSLTSDTVSLTDDTRVSLTDEQNKNILNNNNKKRLSASADEWDFEKEMLKLKDSPRRDLNIIYLYWRKKEWKFENKKQFDSALRRELKPAGMLIGYSGEQILKAIVYCRNNYDPWTLETVHKRITDVVNGNAKPLQVIDLRTKK